MKYFIIVGIIFFSIGNCFGAIQWYTGLTEAVNIDTLTSADTVVTIDITENADGLVGGRKPEYINVITHVNDLPETGSPLNTATVRIQVLIDSRYIDVYILDKDSGDYGTGLITLENMGYDRIRFVVENNTGAVLVYYGLKREW